MGKCYYDHDRSYALATSSCLDMTAYQPDTVMKFRKTAPALTASQTTIGQLKSETLLIYSSPSLVTEPVPHEA